MTKKFLYNLARKHQLEESSRGMCAEELLARDANVPVVSLEQIKNLPNTEGEQAFIRDKGYVCEWNGSKWIRAKSFGRGGITYQGWVESLPARDEEDAQKYGIFPVDELRLKEIEKKRQDNRKSLSINE